MNELYEELETPEGEYISDREGQGFHKKTIR